MSSILFLVLVVAIAIGISWAWSLLVWRLLPPKTWRRGHITIILS